MNKDNKVDMDITTARLYKNNQNTNYTPIKKVPKKTNFFQDFIGPVIAKIFLATLQNKKDFAVMKASVGGATLQRLLFCSVAEHFYFCLSLAG